MYVCMYELKKTCVWKCKYMYVKGECMCLRLEMYVHDGRHICYCFVPFSNLLFVPSSVLLSHSLPPPYPSGMLHNKKWSLPLKDYFCVLLFLTLLFPYFFPLFPSLPHVYFVLYKSILTVESTLASNGQNKPTMQLSRGQEICWSSNGTLYF